MAIFTAIATAFTAISGFIGGLGAVGAFVLRTAVGIGLNLLASAIAGKPKKPQFSIQGTLQSGDDVPRSFILGYGATAGSLVYANTWGTASKTPNAYLTQVIALSDLPVDSLAQVWVNGELCTLDAIAHADYGYPVLGYRQDGTDYLWIKFYDGNQTTADAFLTGTVASAERPYPSTRVGSGVAYVVITSRINEELFTGFPQFKFALNGVPLFDPSTDTTGGDGDHLPAVQIYNLLQGLTFGGKWFYGLQGMVAARLPVAAWIAQIDKCRALIAGPDGDEATYRTGGEIQVGAPIADAIEAILTGCQGRLAEIGGTYKIHVGASAAASFTFSDGEILSTEEQSFTPFFGLADTINGITAKYPNPSEGWNVKVAPPLYRSDLEALAGNRRLMADVSLDLVPYGAQVQRLMKSALEEAQRARRHTLVLPPEFWEVEPGDILNWNSDRNGYEDKLFRVDGVVDRANLDVMVDITEVDPADYDWDQETDYTPVVDGPLGPIRPAPQAIIDWSATASSITDNTGAGRRPAILLGWDGDQEDVAAVAFEVRLATTLEVVYRGRTDNVAAGSILISQGLLPNTAYGVRGRYLPRSARATLWSDWLAVTTPDIKLGAGDIYPIDLDQLAEDVTGFLDDMATDIGVNADAITQEAQDRAAAVLAEGTERVEQGSGLSNRFRETERSLTEIALRISDAGLSAYSRSETLRREIAVQFEDERAAYTEAISIAIGGGSAVAVQLEVLEVEVSENAAAISNEAQARADADFVLASQITLLSAGSGDQFDWKSIWYFDSGVESWTGNGLPTASGGWLRPANHVTDPYVESPIGIGASALQYKQVRLRIRKTGTPAWDGFLYWRTTLDATWDVARRVAIAEPAYDGGIGLITINPEWSTGTIDMIRLDLSSVQDATNYFEIDWVAVGRPSPGASAAALLAEQTARTSADDAFAADLVLIDTRLNDAEGDLAGQATAVSTLEVTVAAHGDDLTAYGLAIDAIEVALPGKASVEAVEAVEASVTELGGGGALTSIGSATAAIRNQLLPLAASVADQGMANFRDRMHMRGALASVSEEIRTSITLTNDELDVVASRVSVVEAAIPGLASLTITTALTARVTATEGSIASQGSAITAIENEIGDLEGELALKAAASAVTALDTRVTSVEGVNSSQATALTAVESSLGDVNAQTRLKMEATAGPTGYGARIGLTARTGTTSGPYRAAALFIDVPVSTSAPTRIALVAEQTVVMTSAGVVSALFDGDTAFFDNARIRNLDATNITAAKIDAAVLLQDGTLIEDLIAAGAVTGAVDEAYNGAVANMSEGDWGDVLTLSIASPSGHPVMFYYNVDVSVLTNTFSGSSYSGHVGARILKNGVLFRGPWEEEASGESSQRVLHAQHDQLIMDAVGVGTVTYKIQAYGGAGGTPANANTSMIAQVNKK